MEAFCVVSDSGTITEESALLGMPAITIRNAHERPEGMDAGTLVMSGLDAERVLDAVRIVTSQRKSKESNLGVVTDYEASDVSKKILRIVLSYVDYINRTVWQKL
jgi:UDP-N-acetylglucosamine 2-epimerase (non-hydrolysing)